MNHRIAVSTFFFTYGFMYANWVSRLPELQRIFNVSNAGLGSILFATACGGLVAMPFVSWLTTRYGTRVTALGVALLFSFILPMIPLNYSPFFTYLIFILIGITGSSVSISMNGQAIYVERMWNKPIMSSFHALFSVGMAMGALSGSLFSKFGVPTFTHFLTIGLLGAVAYGLSYPNMVPDPQDLKSKEVNDESKFTLPTKAILPLGIIAFCGMTGEGSMADWSAIYMHKVVGESEAFGAIAFGIFGAAMTMGRLFGDFFTMRLGKYKLLIADSILAIFGLSIAILFPHPTVTLVGFFLVGLGLSTIVPIVYSTAGNTKGVAPSVGIAMATSIGNLGFFVGPPTIGYIADLLGLRVGLAFPVTLFLLMFIFIVLLLRSKANSSNKTPNVS